MTSPRAHARGPVAPALAVPALVTLLACVVLTAFAWPAVRSAPSDVPIAVVGPAGPVAARLSGAFEVVPAADRAAAEQAVRDREVYGAVAPGPVVLVASGASPAVAAALAGVAAGLSAPVEDLAPLPADDPRGVGLAVGALPLVVAGIVLGALVSLRVPLRARPGALLLGALGVGLALTGLLQGWLGALSGAYLANAGVVALGVAAVGTALAGLHAVGGLRAFGAGAATMVLLGNPLSAAASAPELLPAGWGALGQLLPPGAVVSALRGTAFFDGAGTTSPLVVLACWLVAGTALLGSASARRSRPAAQREAASV